MNFTLVCDSGAFYLFSCIIFSILNSMSKKSIKFVLFGATGDLAVKKIFPALEALFKEGALGTNPQIIAVSRRDWRHPDFHNFLIEKNSPITANFLQHISHVNVDIDGGKGFNVLSEMISLGASGVEPEVLYYTSLAPDLHQKAITGLRDAGLLSRGTGKILIEKPFGTNEKTAGELDDFLLSFLDEKQIFRVDHYLGKDAILAIMDIHEKSSELGEKLVTKNLKSIVIRMFETQGINGRGASYDGVGAFRDVGQNHMLEMLAVIAANVTAQNLDGFDWQAMRADVLSQLAPPAKTCDLSRRAQYVGYHNERGVHPGSETETAFEVITNFSSGKLFGVPLILRSGKKMLNSESTIEIEFKDGKKQIFDVQSFKNKRDAYGNVVFAALQGSRREFVGSAEIKALWRYADHVVACWNKVPLEIYSPEKPFLIQ